MKTRSTAAATAALLAAFALAACSPEEPADGGGGNGGEAAGTYEDLIANGPVADDAAVEASEWASAVREAGTLRIGGTETSELFSLLDPTTGELRGFDAAIGQLLSQYVLGEVNTDFSQVTVDTRESLLQNGDVDVVIATYSITEERDAVIDFAGPYYSSQAGILVQADNTDITGLDDLAGKTVTTQASSTGVTLLEEFAPEAEILPLPDHAQCLTTVQQGGADAYVIDQALLLNAVVSNDDVKIVGEPFGPNDNYGIGVQDGSDGKDFINDFLQQLIDDGTWKQLWQITIGDRADLDTAPEPPTPGVVD